MNIRIWVRNGALLGVGFAAACSGTVISSQSGGTTGSGGAGGATGVVGVGGSTSDVCPCCDGQCSDVSTTTIASSSSGAGGGGAICGGLPGFECPAGQYCDFPDKMCGGNDGEGTCAQRPVGCTEIYDPTCGCDHQVYPNACTAESSGVDADDLGGCTPPAGTFDCGANFCQQDVEYCQIIPGGTSVSITTYVCQPVPTTCGDPPTCACLSGVACGGNCTTSNDGGGLEVICATN